MPRFDVYGLSAGRFLVDVQAFDEAGSKRRVVVPLVPLASIAAPLPTLNPVLKVVTRQLVFMPNRIASIPTRQLPAPIANIAHYRDEIIRALDVLFTGF